jgi:CubicO group peptidase (beta-lactamase class C family)
MDAGRMVNLMNDLAGYPDHWVHGMVVIKNGKLVFEEYFPGEDLELSDLSKGVAYATRHFEQDTLHSVASVSKSVTSILVGIAIDEGLIPGTQEIMFSYFPDYAHLSDATKSQITLAHMLAMASGLPWSEAHPYDDPRNDLRSMVFSDDPIESALDRATIAAPGTQFMYNSGTANLLGEIVRRKSGMTLADFAGRHLFTPLGIDSYEWYAFPNAPEMTVASSTLYLRPRDMAKIGQMYLDGGVWNGTRVVSEEWVSRSVRKAIGMVASTSPIPSLDPAYGYLWWLGTFSTGDTDTYFAAGFGGQFIFVLPEPEMVVVFTAGGFKNRDYGALLQIMNRYVLPAAGR